MACTLVCAFMHLRGREKVDTVWLIAWSLFVSCLWCCSVTFWFDSSEPTAFSVKLTKTLKYCGSTCRLWLCPCLTCTLTLLKIVSDMISRSSCPWLLWLPSSGFDLVLTDSWWCLITMFTQTLKTDIWLKVAKKACFWTFDWDYLLHILIPRSKSEKQPHRTMVFPNSWLLSWECRGNSISNVVLFDSIKHTSMHILPNNCLSSCQNQEHWFMIYLLRICIFAVMLFVTVFAFEYITPSLVFLLF